MYIRVVFFSERNAKIHYYFYKKKNLIHTNKHMYSFFGVDFECEEKTTQKRAREEESKLKTLYYLYEKR